MSGPGITPGTVDGDVEQVNLAEAIGDLARSPESAADAAALFTTSDTPWFVVDGRWVYHLTDDDQWELVAEFEERDVLDRSDAACFADPDLCRSRLVGGASPTAGAARLD